MATEIEKDQDLILKYLHDLAIKKGSVDFVQAQDIQKDLGISPLRINQAVELLKGRGLVEWLTFLNTAPYVFGFLKITSRGEYEFQRRQSVMEVASFTGKDEAKIRTMTPQQLLQEIVNTLTMQKPAIPVGSPYGFSEQDWETVSLWKARKNVLYVVFGCKFDSGYCEYKELSKNIRDMFEQAVSRYNTENREANIQLKFEPLHAGYGEHLFNQIARDIISSDIAVFETSDIAPNIFIEIGVALTGVQEYS